MFFEYFPKTTYENGKDNILVTDFLRAIRIDPKLKEDDIFYDLYSCSDNETPEIISHKVYKSTQYHWVIMLLNEKFDVLNDFPRDDYTLLQLAKNKYSNVDGIHHYENEYGNWVDVFTENKTPVTNIEYERNLNDLKRSIKILKPEFLAAFVQQYRNLIAI